jgi:hypothetical protein
MQDTHGQTYMPRRKPEGPTQRNSTPTNDAGRGRPEVILEFLFERGMFHVSVNNIGDRPAVGVRVSFNKKIMGLNGTKEISSLPLFQNLEYLGPKREIVTFIDASSSYFKRRQPTRILVRVSYRDSDNQKYECTISHNLEIYRDLPYLPAAGEQDP